MFDIHYENEDFVVINKYPGVSVHKDDGDTMLVSDVAIAIGASSLHLVHRLDKMTSGLLILAKRAEVAAQFSRLFEQRDIDKYYLAIGSKKPKKKQGTIIGDMERSRRSSWKLVNSKNNPAVTQFFSAAAENGERVFLCKPLSGKTHQIRVALKSIGSPIKGDAIYNTSDSSDRGYLHAYALRFELSGELFQFRCDPREGSLGEKWRSAEVEDAIDKWSQPWELAWPKK
ncbi:MULTISPECIES: TIGR01621 family pseudouridine synthase [Vibrio]|uniref:TIGR01621 family pseudouridine synthase n=1 Tax=Vibrio mediterranei TaxID=689 RepID=A0ABX5DHN5_9VIBR|nr:MULTISPECIES: TIGR01621 family pseudouridine synthase [Vibrio]EDL53164.1 pseudouridine synthase Rlu family protein [Vibrio mediterranei AK1]KFA96946.1 pseudouridine synthase [Vibrio sp. ER1A]MCF4173109.1 TIGR01621 family pseudouridine synthase [Vibrio sp. McD22-P3]MCG9657332.1 TIGR01621 family pseudouridine synthase [Vibrio mediterranei]MCG9665000.1 TIGR01621 family pseudouridine synthase [Vibrio mediterranei]